MKFSTAAAVAMALAASVVTSVPAAAQSRQDFVVLRGAEVEIINFKQRGAASSKNVVVLKGKPATRRPALPMGPTTVVAGVAGDKIWFVDRENDRLDACRLGKTSTVERWVIRCWTRPLPN